MPFAAFIYLRHRIEEGAQCGRQAAAGTFPRKTPVKTALPCECDVFHATPRARKAGGIVGASRKYMELILRALCCFAQKLIGLFGGFSVSPLRLESLEFAVVREFRAVCGNCAFPQMMAVLPTKFHPLYAELPFCFNLRGCVCTGQRIVPFVSFSNNGGPCMSVFARESSSGLPMGRRRTFLKGLTRCSHRAQSPLPANVLDDCNW